MKRPEDRARAAIDRAPENAGWSIQDEDEMNLTVGLGVAVRELLMAKSHGRADYLLFVDGQAVGALEAKKAEHTLTGVEQQARQYSDGLPDLMHAAVVPLPFLYVSTGIKTRFTNRLDPHTRDVFAPHRPEAFAEWLEADSLERRARARWPLGRLSDSDAMTLAEPAAEYDAQPSSLRGRLRAPPPPGKLQELWPNQQRAIRGLESSLAEDRPRALIQMATGPGKSRMAVAAIYRLIKLAGARRILFLVDRANLGKQAEDEFASYRTCGDHRKLTELYTVQRLEHNQIRSSAKVVITTIQRLCSMLQGDRNLGLEFDEASSVRNADRRARRHRSLQPGVSV